MKPEKIPTPLSLCGEAETEARKREALAKLEAARSESMCREHGMHAPIPRERCVFCQDNKRKRLIAAWRPVVEAAILLLDVTNGVAPEGMHPVVVGARLAEAIHALPPEVRP